MNIREAVSDMSVEELRNLVSKIHETMWPPDQYYNDVCWDSEIGDNVADVFAVENLHPVDLEEYQTAPKTYRVIGVMVFNDQGVSLLGWGEFIASSRKEALNKAMDEFLDARAECADEHVVLWDVVEVSKENEED